MANSLGMSQRRLDKKTKTITGQSQHWPMSTGYHESYLTHVLSIRGIIACLGLRA